MTLLSCTKFATMNMKFPLEKNVAVVEENTIIIAISG